MSLNTIISGLDQESNIQASSTQYCNQEIQESILKESVEPHLMLTDQQATDIFVSIQTNILQSNALNNKQAYEEKSEKLSDNNASSNKVLSDLINKPINIQDSLGSSAKSQQTSSPPSQILEAEGEDNKENESVNTSILSNIQNNLCAPISPCAANSPSRLLKLTINSRSSSSSSKCTQKNDENEIQNIKSVSTKNSPQTLNNVNNQVLNNCTNLNKQSSQQFTQSNLQNVVSSPFKERDQNKDIQHQALPNIINQSTNSRNSSSEKKKINHQVKQANNSQIEQEIQNINQINEPLIVQKDQHFLLSDQEKSSEQFQNLNEKQIESQNQENQHNEITDQFPNLQTKQADHQQNVDVFQNMECQQIEDFEDNQQEQICKNIITNQTEKEATSTSDINKCEDVQQSEELDQTNQIQKLDSKEELLTDQVSVKQDVSNLNELEQQKNEDANQSENYINEPENEDQFEQDLIVVDDEDRNTYQPMGLIGADEDEEEEQPQQKQLNVDTLSYDFKENDKEFQNYLCNQDMLIKHINNYKQQDESEEKQEIGTDEEEKKPQIEELNRDTLTYDEKYIEYQQQINKENVEQQHTKHHNQQEKSEEKQEQGTDEVEEQEKAQIEGLNRDTLTYDEKYIEYQQYINKENIIQQQNKHNNQQEESEEKQEQGTYEQEEEQKPQKEELNIDTLSYDFEEKDREYQNYINKENIQQQHSNHHSQQKESDEKQERQQESINEDDNAEKSETIRHLENYQSIIRETDSYLDQLVMYILKEKATLTNIQKSIQVNHPNRDQSPSNPQKTIKQQNNQSKQDEIKQKKYSEEKDDYQYSSSQSQREEDKARKSYSYNNSSSQNISSKQQQSYQQSQYPSKSHQTQYQSIVSRNQQVYSHVNEILQLSIDSIKFGVVFPGNIFEEQVQIVNKTNETVFIKVVGLCLNPEFDSHGEYVYSIRKTINYDYNEKLMFSIPGYQSIKVHIALKVPNINEEKIIKGSFAVTVNGYDSYISIPITSTVEIPKIICTRQLFHASRSSKVIKLAIRRGKKSDCKIPFKNTYSYTLQLEPFWLSDQTNQQHVTNLKDGSLCPFQLNLSPQVITVQPKSLFMINLLLRPNQYFKEYNEKRMLTGDKTPLHIKNILIFRIVNSSLLFHYPVSLEVY
ncbi:hypothetical protein ABPG74_008559 [Tetrahymena malaccensis]